ncbi:exopolysaccharide biosynthesis protein [Alteriqipengyuania lutimaris]|uniref:Exopolysaccharide biosynthesis protein n=2 Tax=Alteriqipengyuania lutimaris TaxID=1538146 RepID=A0A395LIF0_9SPHN|nr:exopolysaccharide biosynthesis protein [Alteriqipengyuania lutimaris]
MPFGPRTAEAQRAKSSPIQQYLRILRRRRWVILGTIGACIIAGLIATLLMTPQYTAKSTIEISRESSQVSGFEGAERETSVMDQEFYQTQYGLLVARSLAERIASELGLVDDPDFFALFGIEATSDGAYQIRNGRYQAEGRGERLRDAGQILLDNVAIEPERLSRLVTISFESPNPELSARIANAWAENFIETNLERKSQATSYGREALQRQLATYKERLDESQRQLVGYAQNEGIINLPSQSSGDGSEATQERSLVADNLAAINSALNEATADRIAAEARYNRVGGAESSAAALDSTTINNLRQRRAELAADYQQLMVRFEPGYPAAQAIQSQIDDLDRSIAREEARVTNSVTAEYRQAVERENTLQTRVNRLQDEFLDLRRRSIQYNIYQQEVDTNRALYDGLLQRFNEIGVAGGVGINNVAIVDLADVPRDPSSPKLILNLLVAAMGGLALGVGLALLQEQLDDAIGDPSEVSQRLGLPLLGTVPKVDEESEPRVALLDRKSALVDAYIALQTNLAFTTEHGFPRALSVTSTRPAEGKSTTSLALATVLARAKKRVILIDGDMRSPSVHHLGKVKNERGLSNFLTGDEQIEPLTFKIEDLGIDAMAAGPIPPNAAELLTGNRLSTLIDRLLETYDHVVIDSPPVMGLADAPLIASKVEGIVYAVESHGTRLNTVKMAVSRLEAANVRIFGAVLTKFEAKRSDYGYEYGYTYGRETETEAA